MALAAYGAEHAIPHLTPNQLDLIEKILAVLNPVEEITYSISTKVASVSLWNKNNEEREMLDFWNRRYVDAESKETLVLATLIDPHFKC